MASTPGLPNHMDGALLFAQHRLLSLRLVFKVPRPTPRCPTPPGLTQLLFATPPAPGPHRPPNFSSPPPNSNDAPAHLASSVTRRPTAQQPAVPRRHRHRPAASPSKSQVTNRAALPDAKITPAAPQKFTATAAPNARKFNPPKPPTFVRPLILQSAPTKCAQKIPPAPRETLGFRANLGLSVCRRYG